MTTRLTSNPGSTTWFDDIFEAAEVPTRLTGGASPEVVVMDGFVRGTGIVGRSNATAGLIGVKVDSGGRDLRVRLEISVDDATVKWWRKRTPKEEHERSPYQGRLFHVSSQGEDKGALYLARRPLDGAGPTRAHLEFTLRGDQVDPEGLVMIGVDGIEVPACSSLLPNPVLGIRVDAIDLDVATGPVPAQVCGGDSRRPMFRDNVFAFSPGDGGPQSMTLELVPDFVMDHRLADRMPGRYRRITSRVAQKGLKEASNGLRWGLHRTGIVERAIRTDAFDAWAQDMNGNAVPLELKAAPRDRLVVGVPAGSGPVVGGLALDRRLLLRMGYPATTNWSLVR